MQIRESINIVKGLFESPGMVSGTEDFGLNDVATNLKRAKFFDGERGEILHDDKNCRLVILGNTDGMIGLVGKKDSRLHYFVKYETQSIGKIGISVTQVELWRDLQAWGLYPNITKKVFFEVLLKRYPAVMSDRLQTGDGKKFWLNVFINADALAYKVGIIKGSDVVIYDATKYENINDWLEEQDPWGDPNEGYKQKRLIIWAK